VYDVLNTRTSDTNGTPPCPVADAATGNVTVSAERSEAARNPSATPQADRPQETERENVFFRIGRAI
jgi:hypothetical protein